MKVCKSLEKEEASSCEPIDEELAIDLMQANQQMFLYSDYVVYATTIG